jgi:hypothetical protein
MVTRETNNNEFEINCVEIRWFIMIILQLHLIEIGTEYRNILWFVTVLIILSSVPLVTVRAVIHIL